MNIDISVVVPFYNEEENVEPLAEQITAVMREAPEYSYECLFVNDGSTDGTRDRLEDLRARDAHVKPVHLARNSGQSAALVTGMRRAQGAYIVTLDGDLQNDPCDIPAVAKLLADYDVVCGYRAERNDNWVRKLSSLVANKVRNGILHDGIRDSGCGTKGYRRACVDHIVPFNGVHRFMAAVLRASGFTIAEMPVTHHPRIHGESKYGIGNRLWRGIYDMIGVAWLRKRYVVIEVEDENGDPS